MAISQLWDEMGQRALNDTFDRSPERKKEMVQFLFDNGFWSEDKLDWKSALSRFNDCLNPRKPYYFKIGEAWALMKRFGNHDLFLAMAADLGYEVRAIPTEERRMALMEKVQRSLESHEEAMRNLSAELALLGDVDGRAGAAQRGRASDPEFTPRGF